VVVTNNNMVFWVVIGCDSETVRVFRGTYHPHPHGQRVSQEQETGRSRQKPELATCICWYTAGPSLWPLEGCDTIPQTTQCYNLGQRLLTFFTHVSCLAFSLIMKKWLTFSGLHNVKSEKIKLFKFHFIVTLASVVCLEFL
jgi:hypothetical protein